MQINSSDPSARGFGDNSIDSPSDFGQNKIDQNQEQFDSFFRAESEDFDEEIGESGGSSDDELLELEAEDDSVLDLQLSDEIAAESDEEVQQHQEMKESHSEEAAENRKEFREERKENLEESRQEAADEVDRQNEMEDAELMDLDDLQLGMDTDVESDLALEQEDSGNSGSDEIEKFSDREGRSAGYVEAFSEDDGTSARIAAEREEAFDLAETEQDMLDEAEEKEMADTDEAVVMLDTAEGAEFESEMEMQADSTPEMDAKDTSPDKQGRSAGYIEATEMDGDGVITPDEADFSGQEEQVKEKLTEKEAQRLEAQQEEDFQLAEAEQDRLDEVEEKEMADTDEAVVMLETAEGSALESEMEIHADDEALPQMDADDTSPDKQGRSAGYMEATESDGDGVKTPDQADQAGQEEQVKEKVIDESTRRLQAQQEEDFQLAEAEQDRLDEAEEKEMADTDEVQLTLDSAEGFEAQDIGMETQSEEEQIPSEGTVSDGSNSDKQGRSAGYVEVSSLDLSKPTKKEASDLIIEDLIEETQEEESEREDEFKEDQLESSERHSDWMEDVHHNIQEGEQINIEMEDIMEGTLEDRNLAATGEDAPTEGQEMSDQAGNDQKGTRVSTTVGDAILSTMVSSSLNSSMDQQSIMPEFYRLINSIEANYYQHGLDDMAVGEEGSGGQKAVDDGTSFSTGQISGGVVIELKDDKYANLGGTKVSFQVEDGVMSVDFNNDSLHAQELLLEQGELLLKELDDRFPGGIKITLNGELVGELRTPAEDKQVTTTVEWDAPSSTENEGQMMANPEMGEWNQVGTTVSPGSAV